MHVVKLNEIVKRYDKVTAVDHINITIEEGEIYGLLGPNGAGKTTLMNILCGNIVMDKGSISLFEQPFNKKSLHLKKDIGVVPQNIALYDDLTAQENVRFLDHFTA